MSDFSDVKVFICDRCGQDVDTDLQEPKLACRNCSANKWQEKHESQLLTAAQVYIVFLDTGIWLKNQVGETWLDRSIMACEALEGEAQDRAEASLANKLGNMVRLNFEPGDYLAKAKG